LCASVLVTVTIVAPTAAVAESAHTDLTIRWMATTTTATEALGVPVLDAGAVRYGSPEDIPAFELSPPSPPPPTQSPPSSGPTPQVDSAIELFGQRYPQIVVYLIGGGGVVLLLLCCVCCICCAWFYFYRRAIVQPEPAASPSKRPGMLKRSTYSNLDAEKLSPAHISPAHTSPGHSSGAGAQRQEDLARDVERLQRRGQGQAGIELSSTRIQPPPPPARPLAGIVLPPGWEAETTPQGKTYYLNTTTGETQWEKPLGGVEAARCSHRGSVHEVSGRL